jgi:putative tryptophan/tyrosine transport system substrate-binding protein
VLPALPILGYTCDQPDIRVGFFVIQACWSQPMRFSAQHKQIVSGVARHSWPAIYQWREFAEAGGLASFGPNLSDSYPTSRSLRCANSKRREACRPARAAPTKFEFVLNLKTAKTLGLTIPLPLLGRADEVIE